MKPVSWILITGTLALHFRGIFCSYLKTNPDINVNDEYRGMRQAKPSEIKKVILPPFIRCSAPEPDLLLRSNQKNTLRKINFWSRHTDVNQFTRLHFAGRGGDPYNEEIVANDETFLAMSLAPLIIFIFSLLSWPFFAIGLYFAGAIIFWIGFYIIKYVSFQPIRRFIRAIVIKMELLQRRKQAYLRKVLKPSIRKPPKSKYRLYWLWRDYTFEEIPDALAERRDDPLYPISSDAESTSTTDQDSFDYGYDGDAQENIVTNDVPDEKERRKALSEIIDRKITKLVMEGLPGSRSALIEAYMPYRDEQELQEWQKKITNRQLARAPRLKEIRRNTGTIGEILTANPKRKGTKSKHGQEDRVIRLEDIIDDVQENLQIPLSANREERLEEVKSLRRIMLDQPKHQELRRRSSSNLTSTPTMKKENSKKKRVGFSLEN